MSYCRSPGSGQQNFILSYSGAQKDETKVSTGLSALQRPRGGSLLPLPASGGSKGSLACGHLTLTSAFDFAWHLHASNLPLPPLTRTPVIGLRARGHLRRFGPVTLNLTASAQTLLPTSHIHGSLRVGLGHTSFQESLHIFLSCEM